MEKAEMQKRAKELRKNMTKEERKLWYNYLCKHPVRFYRQKIFGNYIVDFYCPKAALVFEIDGAQHYEVKQEQYDSERSEYLKKQFGITVIRILNSEINQNFNGVCEYIDLKIQQSMCNDTPQ